MKEYTVQIKEFDNKSELLENCVGEMLLGDENEAIKCFYKVTVESKDTKLLTIGVFSQGHGLKPTYKLLENTLFIGVDNNLYKVNIIDNKMIFRRLNSLLFCLHLFENTLLAICEADIYCFDRFCQIIWYDKSDLITDYKVTDDKLMITTDDDLIIYDIKTGLKNY